MTPEETALLEGHPERIDDPGQYFDVHLREAAEYDKKTAQQYARGLYEAGELDQAALEVLESLFFLATAHPKVAERLQLPTLDLARRLGARLEREGQLASAIAVLEHAARLAPDNRAVERELAGVMRRAGLVQELVDRYLERSQALLDRGRAMDAIPWLQEILLVDRSRRDIARLIRDLRYQDVEEAVRTKRRSRFAVLSCLGAVLVAVAGLREVHLYQKYRSVAQAADSDLVALETRRAALERFADEHPVWHRSLAVRRELASLRGHIGRLEAQREELESQEQDILAQRRLHAQKARDRGLAEAEAGAFESALEHFEEALGWSDEEWPERAQIEKDMTAIREWLEEGQ